MQNKMWMLGLILIAFFVGMMFSQNTTAQQGAIGRYQTKKDDTGRVWRIDTTTGTVSRCQAVTEDYDTGCMVFHELGLAER